MTKSWTDDAWEDFEYWTEHDKRNLRRLKIYLKTLIAMGIKE